MRLLILALSCLSFLLWVGCRKYNDIVFSINCTGHLKRAADANTVEMAKTELETVVAYLEKGNVTGGYTSILYRTPDEDVGFWYNNLKSSLNELKKIGPEATQLEKTNVLMKLRETLLDNRIVTEPDSISLFPYNIAYAVWGGLSFTLIIIGMFVAWLWPERSHHDSYSRGRSW